MQFAAVAGHGASVPREAVDDPVGVWNCLVYGHPRRGDEQFLFRFQPDGTTGVATPREDGFRIWAPLSDWSARRNRLSFSDSRLGREYEADLRRSTLGGPWISPAVSGGWWCTQISETTADEEDVQRTSAYDLMPPLMSSRMATPRYPRRAIREAREGRAVMCFVVDSNGLIIDPDFVELTDEIFRATTLRAIAESQYRGWDKESVLRPGCRSFFYELDAVF